MNLKRLTVKELEKMSLGIPSTEGVCTVHKFCYDNWIEIKNRKRKWIAESVCETYLRYYNEIFNKLPELESKDISDYVASDFEDAIRKIQKENLLIYDEESKGKIHICKRLVRDLIDYAVYLGKCEDILRYSEFFADVLGEEKTETIITQRLAKRSEKIKRSFTAKQEKKIASFLLNDNIVYGEGVNYGLLLMYALGLRNAEACAIKFSNFFTFESYPDMVVCVVYTSARDGKVRNGGKTSNMPRFIVVPSKVWRLIQKRIDYIESKIGGENVEDFPVACSSEGFKIHLRSNELTDGAEILFEEVGITSADLVVVAKEMNQEEIEYILSEKDPTAYLFRRNFATQMASIGMEEEMIRYLMGHRMGEEYKRNFYSNEEKVYEISLIMSRRALVNDGVSFEKYYDRNTEEVFEFYSGDKVSIKEKQGDSFTVTVETNEPNDDIRVYFFGEGEISVENLQIKYKSCNKFIQQARALEKYYEIYNKE